MIGFTDAIIIGQGEDIDLVFEIEDKQGIFKSEDAILFAMKDIDGNVKHSYSKLVSELEPLNNIYPFIVEFTSALTLSLDIATYFFDVTLIDGDKKHPLIAPPNTIRIEKTVGASIFANENNGGN